MALRTVDQLRVKRVLWSIFLLIVPLAVYGEPSLVSARRHASHHNQSSVSVSGRLVLSDDSAEREHLIEARSGLGAGLPLSAAGHSSHRHTHLDFSEEEPLSEELTAAGGGPDQSARHSSDDIITVEFHSPAPDLSPDWTSPPKALQQKGGNPTTWTLSDFYDYLSPDDDLSAADTTPEPEPSPSPPADVADENPLLPGTSISPDTTPSSDSSAPPADAFPAVTRGQGSGVRVQGSNLGGLGPDGECVLGFVKSDAGGCVSQCDSQPDFCLNGGVCTVADGIGAFCRCNIQEYIWNKGSRCDWMVTEFQVLCLVVGVASVVVLFLFMIVVFFAKRLHTLKKENRQLRKRSSKYRPQSEPQTDGFSVSTVTDGSHPNKVYLPRPSWEYKPRGPYYQDDPQKCEDPVKAPPHKEEETLNIRNSHSPKLENNRPISVAADHGHTPNSTEEMAEVNSTHQNNMV